MPGRDAFYVERLSVRARWWVVVVLVALGGSAELFAGFAWGVIAVVVAAVLLPTLVLLAWAGRTRLVVTGDGITAAGQTMPFDEMESVEGLDARRTRLLLGPEADPTARLV